MGTGSGQGCPERAAWCSWPKAKTQSHGVTLPDSFTGPGHRTPQPGCGCSGTQPWGTQTSSWPMRSTSSRNTYRLPLPSRLHQCLSCKEHKAWPLAPGWASWGPIHTPELWWDQAWFGWRIFSVWLCVPPSLSVLTQGHSLKKPFLGLCF